jgi:hypothetical protein
MLHNKSCFNCIWEDRWEEYGQTLNTCQKPEINNKKWGDPSTGCYEQNIKEDAQ